MSTFFKAAAATVTPSQDLASYVAESGDVGAVFTNITSGFTFVGNSAGNGYRTTAGSNVVVYKTTVVAGSNDITYQADFTIADVTSVQFTSLMFAFVNSTTFYNVQVRPFDSLIYITGPGAANLTSATVPITVAKYRMIVTTTGGGSPTISVAWGLASGSQTAITGLQNIAATGLAPSGKPVGIESFGGDGLVSISNLQATDSTSAGSPPTTLTITGPSSITEGTPATFTATLNTAATAAVSYVPSNSAFTATYSPNPVTFAIGDTAKTFTANSSTAGTGPLGGTVS